MTEVAHTVKLQSVITNHRGSVFSSLNHQDLKISPIIIPNLLLPSLINSRANTINCSFASSNQETHQLIAFQKIRTQTLGISRDAY